MNQPVITTDLLPTFATWAGIDLDHHKELDGESLLPLMQKDGERINPIYWYAPIYLNGDEDYAFRNTPGAAIRKGNFKLVWRFEKKEAELFDLANDISESQNLAKTEVKIYEELFAELKNWLHKTEAEICTTPNPNYDENYASEKYDRMLY